MQYLCASPNYVKVNSTLPLRKQCFHITTIKKKAMLLIFLGNKKITQYKTINGSTVFNI